MGAALERTSWGLRVDNPATFDQHARIACRPRQAMASCCPQTVSTLFPLDDPAQASGVGADPLRVAPAAVRFGFSDKQTGAHMSRSMMLTELVDLMRAVQPDASFADYRRAIVEDNVLGKATVSSREKGLRHLYQNYALDPSAALFRALRMFAQEDPASLQLLAATCAYCRDAQLRHSFAVIKGLRVGEVLSRERMEQHLEAGFPARFSPAMRKSLAQNVITTWSAAGHLAGKVTKTRSLPEPRVASATFAMFAGYLTGLRGQSLLDSVFASLVASDAPMLVRHLANASGRGWVRFRHAGGVFEVDFSPLLTPEEQEVLHGAH
jgi:hypothetical protein